MGWHKYCATRKSRFLWLMLQWRSRDVDVVNTESLKLIALTFHMGAWKVRFVLRRSDKIGNYMTGILNKTHLQISKLIIKNKYIYIYIPKNKLSFVYNFHWTIIVGEKTVITYCRLSCIDCDSYKSKKPVSGVCSSAMILLEVDSVDDTVNGRNPAPPGMYETL